MCKNAKRSFKIFLPLEGGYSHPTPRARSVASLPRFAPLPRWKILATPLRASMKYVNIQHVSLGNNNKINVTCEIEIKMTYEIEIKMTYEIEIKMILS